MLARLKEWNRSIELSGEVDAKSARHFDICIGNLNSTVEALQSNMVFMLSRTASVAQMVGVHLFPDIQGLTTNYKASDTISLKSQNTTETMLRDSTDVRVITIVTLVFLPATFASVRPPTLMQQKLKLTASLYKGFFGMGFFTTDADSGGE